MANGDERLKSAYASMLARRSASHAPPDIPVETVQALAAGTYRGADRDELLDVTLADARTAAEFEFFLDLAREKPSSVTDRSLPLRRRSIQRPWMAAAAMLVIVVGTVGVWRAVSSPTADPLRSDESILIEPAANASIDASSTFVWRRVSDARDYHFELVAADGSVVHQAVTSDTTLLLPMEINIGPGTYVWWVTTLMRDGSQNRSPSRQVLLR